MSTQPRSIVRAPEPVLDPMVQEHIANWSRLLEENQRLRQENQDLHNEVRLQRNLVEQKEILLQEERQRFTQNDRIKEKYLRYAQEILTNGGTLRETIMTAGAQLEKVMARAMELAQQHEPSALLQQVEREVGRVRASAEQIRE